MQIPQGPECSRSNKGFHRCFARQQLWGGWGSAPRGAGLGIRRPSWFDSTFCDTLDNSRHISLDQFPRRVEAAISFKSIQKPCLESLNKNSLLLFAMINSQNMTERFRVLPHLIASTKSKVVMPPSAIAHPKSKWEKQSRPKENINVKYCACKRFTA